MIDNRIRSVLLAAVNAFRMIYLINRLLPPSPPAKAGNRLARIGQLFASTPLCQDT